MTLSEVIISMTIIAIVIAIIAVSVGRIATQAYMARANDSAEVIYMALQSSLNDLKKQGKFEETFSQENKNAGEFHEVPDIAIEGGTVAGVTVPGVRPPESAGSTQAEKDKWLDEFKTSKNLIYMQISKDGSEDSKLLRKLLKPYIKDESIFKYSILVEVNLNNKTVRCAFYSEKAAKLSYFKTSTATLTKAELNSKENILLREQKQLYDKRQGYHGSLGVGEPENLGLLENAYVKVNNDDKLAVEWGEIGPVSNAGGVTDEKRKLFTGMSYEVKIVNAYDTSKIFYKIEGVSAYNRGENYAATAKAVIKDNLGNVRTPMPIYDLYGYTDVNYSLDKDLMVPFKTTELQTDGSLKVYDGKTDATTFKHRLSYYVPADKLDGGETKKQYGVYRLELDSITPSGDTELSIRERYPAIPWDEDFKVIVTGKYDGEGFTGSTVVSADQDNGYVSKKTLNPEEDLYVNGKRGANAIEEALYYLENKNNRTGSNMWYEADYGRHLNNMRYIVGYQDVPGTTPKNGKNQNFLLTDDIDWSLQKLGEEKITRPTEITKLHRLTVSNANGSDLTVTDTGQLMVMDPIAAYKANAGDKSAFEGKFLSSVQRDVKGEIKYKMEADGVTPVLVNGEKVPLYNNYKLSNLKLTNSGKAADPAKQDENDNVGLFEHVGQNGYLRNFMVNGVAAYGNDNVGSIAGEFEGYAKNITILKNETPNYHKRIVENAFGKQEEVVIKNGARAELKPWNYQTGKFKGNTVVSDGDNAGGVFGTLAIGRKATLPQDGKSGKMLDVSNGTRLISLYDGKVNNNENQTQQNPRAGYETQSNLNGINIEADSYAGGLVGYADSETELTKVVNTGAVTADSYAGGIAGKTDTETVISGLKNLSNQEVAAGEKEAVIRTYDFNLFGTSYKKEYTAAHTNYGTVTAENYAGGIVGIVNGSGTAGKYTDIKHVSNEGPVKTKYSYAGGIAAVTDANSTTVSGIRIRDAANRADVSAGDSYAGGIAASVNRNTVLEGVVNKRTPLSNGDASAAGINGVQAGIYAKDSYAGGITGEASDRVSVKNYKMEYTVGGKAKDSLILTVNNEDINVLGSFSGGIAGLMKDRSRLNENDGKEIQNTGTIKAKNYAGGIAGAAVNNTVIRNVLNSSNTAKVKASESYAGGIAGFIGTQHQLGIDTDRTALVSLEIDDITAGAQNYYTNKSAVSAGGSNAGGIAGYADTEELVYNLYNQASVTAGRDNAGGILGTMGSGFHSAILYDETTVQNRLTWGNSTNQGDIRSRNNAGGIVGFVRSDEADSIWDTFNSGNVTADDSNAGGIAGELEHSTNGPNITYSDSVLDNKVIPRNTASNDTVYYMNTGSIRAGSNAGGIAGTSRTDLINLFNGGSVYAVNNNAGGIAGTADYDGNIIKITYKNNISARIPKYYAKSRPIYTNKASVTAGGSNAGGVLGKGEKVTVTDVMNSGMVTANNSNAGGIVGSIGEDGRINNSLAFISDSTTALAANNLGSVKANYNNAGGIVGYAEKSVSLRDMFNKGSAVTVNGDNAGGIAGYISGRSEIVYTQSLVLTNVIKNHPFMANQGSIQSGRHNAGGIAGKVQGVFDTGNPNNSANLIKITNAFSGREDGSLTVKASRANAGGTVGRLTDGIIKNDAQVTESAIVQKIYTNNSPVTATANAGGIVGNADGRDRADDRFLTASAAVFDGIKTGSGTDKNMFQVYDVYNNGAVTATNCNAGGVFGIAGDGTYTNDKALVQKLTEQGMSTNNAAITASGSNAGGIFGFASEKFERTGNTKDYKGDSIPVQVADVFNKGKIQAGYNAGGIAGKAVKLELRYSEKILTDVMYAQDTDTNKFLYTNRNTVTANYDNAGGIVGDADRVVLQDTFNSAAANHDAAQLDTSVGVKAGRSNAGGIAGRAKGLQVTYSKIVSDAILSNRDYVYTNMANVQAGTDNAGGILGFGNGYIQLSDIYNMGSVAAGRDNAGGLAGKLTERSNQQVVDASDKWSPEGIAAEKNRVLDTDGPDLDLEKDVSYITYQSISTSGNTNTNRYSSRPKKAAVNAKTKDNITAGQNNAGGIVGFLDGTAAGKSLRVENVFNSGASYTVKVNGKDTSVPICGIRAKVSNAGGIAGKSVGAGISYSFDINPGPNNRSVDNKGDHSTFAEAFNDQEVREDPYAINGVGLHMVANNASVRATSIDEGVAQSSSQAVVDFATGEQTGLRGQQNAGGAVGYMEGGKIERVYSLKGSVESPQNVGGVVGYAKNVIVKQASRMDGEAISLDTKLNATPNPADPLQQNVSLKTRGSRYVGGIVGYAYDGTEILDTRNYVSVDGRSAVGGITGFAGRNVKVTLAQNAQPVKGVSVQAENVRRLQYPGDTEEVLNGRPLLSEDAPILDKSKADGAYIGGIVGQGDISVEVTMAKNDPLLTDEFKELQEVDDKYVSGGNPETAVTGKIYVGGITGTKGIINYCINTGQVSGVKILGGVSGSGYRITNSFNTANVTGVNNYIYINGTVTPTESLREYAQATHIGGIAGEVGERTRAEAALPEQRPQAGSYIQSAYNSAQVIRGASYTGGIAGYAVAPIDVAYNSAKVSAKQSASSGGDSGASGNKIGGIAGILVQDYDKEIKVTNSYSTGEIIGTSERGTIIGQIEGFASEILNVKRVQNSYYLSDNEIKFFDGSTSQVASQINYGLKPLDLEGVDIDTVIETGNALTMGGDIWTAGTTDKKRPDTEFGLRNYTNMVRTYLGADSGGGGYTPKGEENLQKPLNRGIGADSGNRLVQKSKTGVNDQRSKGARYAYPYAVATIQAGVDYEFPQLDFTGASVNDQADKTVGLGDYTAELPGNNQAFSSVDNTKVSYYSNYWPTKAVDYMQVKVSYDNGGNDDSSVYDEGKLVAPDNNKTGMNITYRANDKYPVKRETRENITLESFLKVQMTGGEKKTPDYIQYDIYDGHSRGRYNYDDTTFENLIAPKAPVKTYSFTKKSAYERDFGPGAQPKKFKTVNIQGQEYYFYLKETNNETGDDYYDAIDKINVSATESPDKTSIKVQLPCEEMNSYLPATNGYFTTEVTKVYDTADGIPKENVTTQERTSRMFSMHFSNMEIEEEHNDSILDKIPNFDFDDIDANDPNHQIYNSEHTAALGSTLLMEDADNPGEYKEDVANRLQIRNERHLYNMNQGETMGYANIGSSNLKYLTNDIELKNNIQMSTDNTGYNGFVIGASNQRMYRMTGSLDGNGYSIGNLRVNRLDNGGNFDNWNRNDYALIYDLSGGVVKNLYIGDDSKIVAQRAAGLAYYVSNGRAAGNGDPYKDINNALMENLGPQLPKETGTDAKIYSSTVAARINAKEAGGFSLYTARRFKGSADIPSEAAGKEAVKQAVTFTDDTFAGKINALYDNDLFMVPAGNNMALQSERTAGILCYVSGNSISDDIDTTGSVIRRTYRTKADVNGSQVAEEGYVSAQRIAAGIICQALYENSAGQSGVIRKSANNGAVVAPEQANGIAQGIQARVNADYAQKEICENRSYIDVTYSYNNGIVQTDDTKGLASGIGNNIRTASYCTNNGSVYGKIASGISSYSDKHVKVNQNVNNGYVQGTQVAGGIVAAPSQYTDAAHVDKKIQAKITNSYNAGTVVVTKNTDNLRAEENTYAGGIIGYASGPSEREFGWNKLKLNDVWKTIADYDDIVKDYERKTVVRNCYNVGMVRYAQGYTSNQNGTMNFSDNNRNIGGITGGSMNRFVDIQNCYSLSDPEVKVLNTNKILKLNKGNIANQITDFAKYQVQMNAPLNEKSYNYRLTAVGDVPYGQNVTTMTYQDMQNLSNFTGFNSKPDDSPENVWTIDYSTKDAAGNILYPFPQFKERQTAADYVGDKYLADTPDFTFNVSYNEKKNNVPVIIPDEVMDTSDVSNKAAVESTVSYQNSEYSIKIKDYDSASDYFVTVYDGDAYAQNYSPAVIRKYEISRGGAVTGGGKLHNSKSTTLPEGEMKFFDPANITFDIGSGKLTIGNKEEAGYYMPNSIDPVSGKINGYYTVVVTKGVTRANNPGTIARTKALLAGDGTVSGILKTSIKSATSDRFQIHFGGAEADGSNIQSRGIVDTGYKYGKENNPYHVTDQYSLIGMTTSGIARRATEDKHYKQTENFTVSEPFYSIYEFNGTYDGTDKTITQRNGDAGFISYARNANIQNISLDIKAADSDAVKKLGKYQEASNYTANIGLIADYAEASKLQGITTNGEIKPEGFHDLASEYYMNGRHTLAGIAAFIRDSEVVDSKNNAALGVKETDQAPVQIPLADGTTLDIPYKLPADVRVEIGGIAVQAIDSKFKNISNNGQITAAFGAQANAAGLIHTIEGNKSSIIQSMNGGWVKAHNGTAAGLVLNQRGGVGITQVYNSGKVTAFAIKQAGGSGKAVGGINSIASPTQVTQMYNAGMVSGFRQGALSGSKVDLEKCYYLKDESYYWGDSHSLPNLPSMEVADIDDVRKMELYLGIARIPTESWGFVGDTRDDYTIPADPVTGTPESYQDPYAVTYKELTDKDTITAKGLEIDHGVWVIDPTPANDTIDSNNRAIRDYAKDPYPLPQFKDYRHKTRAYLNFPIFYGEASQTGKQPYDGEVKYVDPDGKYRGTPVENMAPVISGSQVFNDTIMVDLNDRNTVAKYQVLLYDGDARADDIKDKQHAKEIITVERKYIDLREDVSLAEVSSPNNMQYSRIYPTGDSYYYYEVIAETADGQTRRPAVFARKDFKNGTNDILFNNNMLDGLSEPGDASKPYYSTTIVQYEIPNASDTDKTDPDKFYSKFSPHFADATVEQNETWQYGSQALPYQIASQRNLYNIGLGGLKNLAQSHYLDSDYKQSQDVILKEKKTSITAMQNQEGALKTLWQRGIGTPTLKFNGDYSGGGKKIREQRSAPAYSIFNRISSQSTIHDSIYMLEKNLAAGANALLVGESAGTISNITVDSVLNPAVITLGDKQVFGIVAGETVRETGIPKIEDVSISSKIKLTYDQKNRTAIGSVIGQAKDSVDLNNVSSGASLTRTAPLAGSKTAIGGIAGQFIAKDESAPEVSLQQVNYTGTITESNMVNESIGGIAGTVSEVKLTADQLTASKDILLNAAANKAAAGGLFGRFNGVQAEITDSSVAGGIGSVSTGSSHSGGSFGGIIGESVNAQKLKLNNVQAGQLSTSQSPLSEIKVNASSAANEYAVGGIIGKAVTDSASPDAIEIGQVTNNNKLTVTRSNIKVNAGGIIGMTKAYPISIKDTENLGYAEMTSAAGGTYGGIVGYADHAPQIEMTQVTSGILTKTASTYTGTNNDVYFGGIIGRAVTDEKNPADKITFNQVSNQSGLKVQNSYTSGTPTVNAGGIIGYAQSYEISMNEVENQGGVEVTQNTGSGTLGGIIGYADKVPRIQMDKVTSGVLDTTSGQPITNASYTGKNGSIGGLIGKAVPGAAVADPEIKLSEVSQYNHLAMQSQASKADVGGLVGYIERYNVNVENAESTGNITSTSTDGGTLGGIIGYADKVDQIQMTDVTAGTTGGTSAYSGSTVSAGGLIGRSVPQAGAAGAKIDLTDVHHHNNLSAQNGNTKADVGGLLGYIERYEVSVDNSESTGSVTASSTAGGTLGGIIGYADKVDQIQLTQITSGTAGSTSAYSGTNGSMGGLIGKAVANTGTVGAKIDLQDITQRNSLSMQSGVTKADAGGLLGYIEAYELAAKNIDSTGSMNVTASDGTLGGIIGNANLVSQIQMESVVTGAAGSVYDYRGSYGSIGGLIGKSLPQASAPGAKIGLTDITQSSSLSVQSGGTKTDTGGLLGYIERYEVSVENAESTGNIGSTSTAGGTVGGIIGYANKADQIQFTQITSGTAGSTSAYSGTSGSMGGLIGKAVPNTGAVGAKIDLQDITQRNSLSMQSGATKADAGGLLGYIEAYELAVKNIDSTGSMTVAASNGTLGGIIGNANLVSQIQMESVVTGAAGSVYDYRGSYGCIGGLIGKSLPQVSAPGAKIDLTNITQSSSLSVQSGGTKTDTGGLLGYIERYKVSVENAESKGNIGSTGTSVGTVGGIIGYANKVDQIQFTQITSGTAGSTSAYSGIDGSVGGLIGKAVPNTGAAGAKIDLTDITQSNSLSVQNGNTKADVGGLLGYIERYEVNVENAESTGNISSTSTARGASGGIIGNAYKIDRIQMSNITAGTAGLTSVYSGSTGSMGGLIGKAVPNTGAAGARIDLTDITQHNSLTMQSGSTKADVGGLIGYIETYEVAIKNAESIGTLNVTSNTGTLGGIIGNANQIPQIKMETVTAGTAGMTSSYNGRFGSIGGLIGKAIPLTGTAGAKIDLADVHHNNNLTVQSGGRNTDTGGLLGYMESYELSVKNAENTGSVSSMDTAEGTLGGIIGYANKVPKIHMEQVTAGALDSTTGLPVTTAAYGGRGGNAGGIIGKASAEVKSPADEIIMIDVTNNSNIAVKNGYGSINAGGVIGYVKAYKVIIDASAEDGTVGSKGSVNAAYDAAGSGSLTMNLGGILGTVERSPVIIMNHIESGIWDGAANAAKSSIGFTKGSASPTGNVTAGGIIGQAYGALDSTGQPEGVIKLGGINSNDKAVNNSDIIMTDLPAGGSHIAGGIIGYEEAYTTTINKTVNRGTIDIRNLGDETSMYSGGFVGKIKSSNLTMINSMLDGTSDIVNKGHTKISIAVQRPTAADFNPGTVYTAGGVGFSENSEIGINGFRNSGNIEITGANKDANIYAAGVTAFSMYLDPGQTPGQASAQKLFISNGLNEGNISDSRTELTDAEAAARPRTEGYSLAGGITARASMGAKLEYNQNAGALKATNAAGIVYSIEGTENIAGSDVKYNINVGLIDVSRQFENGADITATAELPIGQDADGNEYNGLGQKIVTTSTIEEGTEETPEEPPADSAAPAITEYYNIALEDMIRPEKAVDTTATAADEATEPEAPEEPAEPEPISAIVLSLAEMQDLGTVQTKSGWGDERIALKDAPDSPQKDSPWMMEQEVPGETHLLVPTLRQNAYVPNTEVHYLAKAAHTAQVEKKDDGSYQVSFTYEDTIDDTKDGFAVMLETPDGEAQRILELSPGTAVRDADNDKLYTFDIQPSYIADITNHLEDATKDLKISVAAMRDGNGRRMSSSRIDVTLDKTTGITEDSNSLIMVIGAPASGISYNMGYDGSIGNAAVKYALTRLGDPYSMPLAGQGRYLDCSYLMLESYRSVGINLPRTAAEQAKYCADNGFTVSRDELMPGDMVFFSFERNGRYKNISHVAMYIGDGKVVEASSTKGQVVVGNIYAESMQVMYGRPYVANRTVDTAPVGVKNADELYLIAQIVGLEAGGEGRDGMIAVAEVIRNRVLSSQFPNTPTEVVAAPGQFTTYAMVNRYVPTQEQLSIVQQVMEGKLSILNNPNCLYFCSKPYYESKGKYSKFWGNMKVIAEYGNCFFVP